VYRVPTPYLAGVSWELDTLDTLDTLPTNTATEPNLGPVIYITVGFGSRNGHLHVLHCSTALPLRGSREEA
jgi:hypothetical protein